MIVTAAMLNFPEVLAAVKNKFVLFSEREGLSVNFKKSDCDFGNKKVWTGMILDTHDHCVTLKCEKIEGVRTILIFLCEQRELTFGLLEKLVGKLYYCSNIDFVLKEVVSFIWLLMRRSYYEFTGGTGVFTINDFGTKAVSAALRKVKICFNDDCIAG